MMMIVIPDRIGGFTSNEEKNESQTFNGCPIKSHSIGQEKLRTVFVFALAHLEGPPQAHAFYNGDINGKKSKKLFFGNKICYERITMV